MQAHTRHTKALRVLAAVLAASFLMLSMGAGAAFGDSPGKPGPVRPLSSQVITGNPISITVEDNARLDITYGGTDKHQFYDGKAEGVYLWAESSGVTKVFGPEWVPAGNWANPLEFVSNTKSGTGTAADPYLVTTVQDVPGTPLRLTQLVKYVNGAEMVEVQFMLEQRAGSAPIHATLFHAADLYTAGINEARGYHDAAAGSVGDYVATTTGNFYNLFVPNSGTPATAYKEGNSHTIWDAIGEDISGPGPGLDNTIIASTLHDSGAALQWNITVPATGNVSVGDTLLFSKQPQLCGQFSDVPNNVYYYNYVRYLTCSGIVSGYSDGTFRPNNTATRAQLSKMLMLARGWAIDTSGGPHFSDVPESNAFYPYIETAYHRGVISGYSDGTFRWGSTVTRGQTTKMVVTAMAWPIDTSGGAHFIDVPTTNPFYMYVETAFHHQIISGYDDQTFRWGNDVTRGQMSKILYLAIAPITER